MLVSVALILSTSADPGDQFLREYPDQVIQLRARLEGTRGTASVCGVVNAKFGPSRQIRYATRPGSVKYEFEASEGVVGTKGPGEAVVYCRVDRHCFRLQKEDSSTQYVVSMYGDGTLENAMVHHDFARFVESPWSLANMTIAEMMKKKHFKLLKSSELVEKGRSLVEVEFETGDAPDKLAKIRAAFDPGLNWAIVWAELSPPNTFGRAVRSDVEYQSSAEGRFFVKSAQIIGLDSKMYRCNFPQVEFVTLPESEFTMAHYGLKDPALKSSSEPAWLYWLAGFLGFAILAFLGRWSRRMATKMSQ